MYQFVTRRLEQLLVCSTFVMLIFFVCFLILLDTISRLFKLKQLSVQFLTHFVYNLQVDTGVSPEVVRSVLAERGNNPCLAARTAYKVSDW